MARLTPDTVEEFLTQVRSGMTMRKSAMLRAAVWTSCLRQNRDRLTQLIEAVRQQSARTLTNLTAQDLLELEQTLEFLAGRDETAIEYDAPLGGSRPPAGLPPGRRGHRGEALRLLGLSDPVPCQTGECRQALARASAAASMSASARAA